MNRLLAILGLFLCTTVNAQISTDFIHSQPLQAISEINNTFESGNCLNSLRSLSQALKGVSLTQMDENWQKDPDSWMPAFKDTLQKGRNIAREEFRDLYMRGEAKREDVLALREIYRIGTFAEHYMDAYLRRFHKEKGKEFLLYKGEGYEDFELRAEHLKAGDVLLSRGDTLFSAAIGEFPVEGEDGSYSHLALVTENENGELVIVESLIETGVHIITPEEYLARDSARGAIFRNIDERLARVAAALMYTKAKTAIDAGRPLPYNFEADMNARDKYFCTQLAHEGFEDAWRILGYPGDYKLPTFASSVPSEKYQIVRRLGMKAAESFSPGDMIVQPDFDLVAEYTYPYKMEDILVKDVVLSTIFTWEYEHGYQLKPSIGQRALSLTGKMIRATPGINRIPKIHKIPGGMPLQAMTYGLTLTKVGEILMKEMRTFMAEKIKEQKHGITVKDAMDFLEEFRKRDKEGKRRLHKYFRVPD